MKSNCRGKEHRVRSAGCWRRSSEGGQTACPRQHARLTDTGEWLRLGSYSPTPTCGAELATAPTRTWAPIACLKSQSPTFTFVPGPFCTPQADAPQTQLTPAISIFQLHLYPRPIPHPVCILPSLHIRHPSGCSRIQSPTDVPRHTSRPALPDPDPLPEGLMGTSSPCSGS